MPSSSTRVAKLLADLAGALSTRGIRWYLFGAQAAILHGASRLTADVDVTLDLGNQPIARLIESLGRRGFEPQIPDPAFIEITRVLPIIHRRTRIPVDLVLAGPGLEDLFFQRARAIRVGATTVNVAAPEDLITMKVLSGRPKDLDDIETLLTVRRNDLQIGMIRETLRLAESLLDQSDLLPVFERLLAGLPKSRPPPAARRVRAKPASTSGRRPRRRE